MEEEERTIEITVGGKLMRVYAGNAALRRYRMAGGTMEAIGNVDTEGGNPADNMLDAIDSLALLLYSNLVDPPMGMGINGFINGFEQMADIYAATEELLAGVPWLKNGAAAGTGPK